MEEEIRPGCPETPDLVPDAVTSRAARHFVRRDALALRTAAVGALRVRGYGFRQIGKKLGVDVHTAHTDWKRFLEENKPSEEDRDQYREIQKARLEGHIRSLADLIDKAERVEPTPFSDIRGLYETKRRHEESLMNLLGTRAPEVLRVEGSVGVEVDGSLEITAEDWARALELKATTESVRRLLPVSFSEDPVESHAEPVIDVEAIVPASNGNGNGHG